MSKSFAISMGALAISTKTATQPGARGGNSAKKKSSISTDKFFEAGNDVFADNTFGDDTFDAPQPNPKGRTLGR